MTTASEKNPCPQICTGMGAFKKVNSPFEESQRTTNEKQTDQIHTHTENQKISTSEEHLPELKPGPEGQIDWSPLGGMTRARPAVHKYTVSRYSDDEWTKHNEDVLCQDVNKDSNMTVFNIKTAMMQAFGNVDWQQTESNSKLKERVKDLFRWKVEVEKACQALSEEIELLNEEAQRMRMALRVLMLPESILKETLELRTTRFQQDLVLDSVEKETKKELVVVQEVIGIFKKLLIQIKEQIVANKAAKHKLEYDWSDKTESYDTDTLNLTLTPNSKMILFRPGATKFVDNTASMEYWEYFCRNIIETCEGVRQKSIDLRAASNATLINGGRTVRAQADKTDVILAESVAKTHQLCVKAEEILKQTLRRIVDMEALIKKLQDSVYKMDGAMKLAQTRLDNRNNQRPHGENARDPAHLGLIEEVRKIHETVSQLLGQIKNATRMRDDLIKKRTELEKDIARKRQTLVIDRDRCGMMRSHYPTALEIAGF